MSSKYAASLFVREASRFPAKQGRLRVTPRERDGVKIEVHTTNLKDLFAAGLISEADMSARGLKGTAYGDWRYRITLAQEKYANRDPDEAWKRVRAKMSPNAKEDDKEAIRMAVKGRDTRPAPGSRK